MHCIPESGHTTVQVCWSKLKEENYWHPAKAASIIMKITIVVLLKRCENNKSTAVSDANRLSLFITLVCINYYQKWNTHLCSVHTGWMLQYLQKWGYNFHPFKKNTHTANRTAETCSISVGYHVITVWQHRQRCCTASSRNASHTVFPNTSSKCRLVHNWLRWVHHVVGFRFRVCRWCHVLTASFTYLHVCPVNFEASYPWACR